MSETVMVTFRLRALVRQETENLWEAICRSLDVASQGDTQEAAKENLQEAVTAWIDACIERDTLGDALRELGFNRVPAGTPTPPHVETITMSRVEELDSKTFDGVSFPIEVTIPAYQIAAISG